jgi:hypothetical protein
MYILIDSKTNLEDRFQNIGLSEDQIWTIVESEKAINALIEQYILNLRFKANDMDFETGDDYMQARLAVKTLQNFQAFMHDLPLQKQEYERRKIVDEAERKLEEEEEEKRKRESI